MWQSVLVVMLSRGRVSNVTVLMLTSTLWLTKAKAEFDELGELTRMRSDLSFNSALVSHPTG